MRAFTFGLRQRQSIGWLDIAGGRRADSQWMTEDDKFLESFETCTLTQDKWHHREHIRVAYLYLCRYPLETAMARMRSGLKALNAVHQVPEALDRGYHETLTLAWMRLVHCALCEFGPAESSDAFMDKQTQLLSKRALLLFYSRDRIMSFAAKAKFLEPDLAPLPQSRKSGKPGSQVTK